MRSNRFVMFTAPVALVATLGLAPTRAHTVQASPPVAAVSQAAGVRPSPQDVVPGQAVVRFRSSASAASRASALHAVGARTIRNLAVSGWTLVAVPGAVHPAVVALAHQPAIAEAEPNLRLMTQAAPNDPCTALTKRSECPATAWNLAAVSAQAGWDRFPGGYFSPGRPKSVLPGRVKIAVIDTPMPRGIPDFKNGYSSDDLAYGGQLDVAGMVAFPHPVAAEDGPYAYHGTYVSSLAAASADNGLASAGLGYVAEVLPLPAVHGADGRAEESVVGDAIVFAYSRGARVIAMALGLTTSSSYVNAAIQQVVSSANPPLVVAAGGNNTGSAPFYPAWFDNVLAVGGTDAMDRKASCANASSHISVSAPAKGVQGLASESTMIAPDCGTSAATPHVAGLAALLFAQNPYRSAADVRSIIERTADDLGPPGRDDAFGYGRINVDRALADGTGAAVTTNLAATPVRASGGTSLMTAHIGASLGLASAEMYLDRQPGNGNDRGIPVPAADGAFDSSSEDVALSFGSTSLAAGAHRIYVRGIDAAGVIGPLSSSIVFVDGAPPAIAGLKATTTLRPLDTRSAITFAMSDDYSRTLSYVVEVTSSTVSRVRVFLSERVTADAGEQETAWSPLPTDLPGSYSVKVTARDEAGNESSLTVSMLLI